MPAVQSNPSFGIGFAMQKLLTLYLLKNITIFLRSRTMKSSKRKRRSDKFPLTLHPTGQYCKKIKGRIRYFGTDKKQALERYLGQPTYLHGCQRSMQTASNGKMTLKELCDLYLKYQHSMEYQHSRVLADERMR
jgi:hypothetical protein